MCNTGTKNSPGSCCDASGVLGQPGRVWCAILAPRTLQVLAVMLQEERRLNYQLQIRPIVGQIKKNVGWLWSLQPDIVI